MGIESGTIGRRESSRLRLAMPAKLDLIGGLRRCVLADISRSGARLELSDGPSPGEFGVLFVDTLEAFGTVVWRSPSGCGFHFDEPVSDADLLALRATQDHAPDYARQASIEFARKWVEGG